MLSTAWKISKLWPETTKLKLPNIREVRYCTTFYMLTNFKVKPCKQCKVYCPPELVNKYYILPLQHSVVSHSSLGGFGGGVIVATNWMLLTRLYGFLRKCFPTSFSCCCVPELLCPGGGSLMAWCHWVLCTSVVNRLGSVLYVLLYTKPHVTVRCRSYFIFLGCRN